MARTSTPLAVLAAAAVAGCGAAGAASPGAAGWAAPRRDGGNDVTLTAADGVKLAATHWAGPGANERCVVLVHQLSSTREEWAPLVERLRGRYELLALDLRGHGGSTRGPAGPLAWRSFGEQDWQAAVRDLEAAERWLGERGFRAADCAWIGSSIGASLVVRFAGARPDAGALVLLSPGLAYRGLTVAEAAAAYPGPALVIHSQEAGAAETAEALERAWGARLERLEIAGIRHGVHLVEDPALLDLVVAFVERAPAAAADPEPEADPAAAPDPGADEL
jgi:pimeloyl-ACP methyl ester carboxylesterase